MAHRIKPWLHANHSREDKEAIRLLQEKKIPYEDMGPSWELPTPFLEYGFWTFTGIKGIKCFVEKWEQNKLPPVEL